MDRVMAGQISCPRRRSERLVILRRCESNARVHCAMGGAPKALCAGRGCRGTQREKPSVAASQQKRLVRTFLGHTTPLC